MDVIDVYHHNIEEQEADEYYDDYYDEFDDDFGVELGSDDYT